MPSILDNEIVHVNGPARIWFGPGGSNAGADYSAPEVFLQQLGKSDPGGVTITPTLLRQELKSDYFGDIPRDFLHLGQICRVEASLAAWNADRLEVFRGGIKGRAAGCVSSKDIGRMIVSAKRYFHFLVESAARTGGVRESPYRCEVFIPMEATPVTIGTTISRVRISGIGLPHKGFAYVRA